MLSPTTAKRTMRSRASTANTAFPLNINSNCCIYLLTVAAVAVLVQLVSLGAVALVHAVVQLVAQLHARTARAASTCEQNEQHNTLLMMSMELVDENRKHKSLQCPEICTQM